MTYLVSATVKVADQNNNMSEHVVTVPVDAETSAEAAWKFQARLQSVAADNHRPAELDAEGVAKLMADLAFYRNEVIAYERAASIAPPYTQGPSSLGKLSEGDD